jgi:phenylpyruvate tautomerase PptA (4-oxalocrotonate tautomerase family)
MTTQNYFVVEENTVNNLVVWDGDVNTWQPPANATMLVADTTPAMVWEITTDKPPTYVLVEEIGQGDIGFTWNGSVLTTNQPMPTPIPAAENQPTTNIPTA